MVLEITFMGGKWIPFSVTIFGGTLIKAATSLSDARQQEVAFLHSWALILNKFGGKSSL